MLRGLIAGCKVVPPHGFRDSQPVGRDSKQEAILYDEHHRFNNRMAMKGDEFSMTCPPLYDLLQWAPNKGWIEEVGLGCTNVFFFLGLGGGGGALM